MKHHNMNTVKTDDGTPLNSNDLLAAPVRLCCGKRHLGPVCPDGKVMCCLCFSRVDQDQLNVAANGQKEDVCKKCDELEKAHAEVERLEAILASWPNAIGEARADNAAPTHDQAL